MGAEGAGGKRASRGASRASTVQRGCALYPVPSSQICCKTSASPSAEVDIKCSWANGKLKVGEGNDWLEILGSGMVHPKVLEAAGVNANEYQGFAFGMGIDRIAMLKYGIPDLRSFFDSDLRWLKHYGFRAIDIPSIHSGISNTSIKEK